MSNANEVSPSDSGFDAVVMNFDFGDYCCIEQKRYGAENEIYQYKVIGRGRANYYRSVPVDANDRENKHGEMCDVLKVICCGVSETKVETFREQDVKPSHFKGRFNS